MNHIMEENNQNLSDLQRAGMLRKEAELLESRERIRGKLRQLMEMSKDPEYDKYLAQMLKDLDSGRATPQQVEREAVRSYELYKQRMSQAGTEQRVQRVSLSPVPQEQPSKKDRPDKLEFNVGIHVFSLVGAIFVLTAFVIFSFNFLDGLGQGICLYLAAFVLVFLSELLFRKKMPKFSHVITGIGIGGLYIANIVNYLVLHTINGLVALLITFVIALGTIFLSHKKDSVVMRIISILGCYISFIPVEGFDTELTFLVIAGILFMINTLSVFLQNQKNSVAINILHISINVIFTALLTGMARSEDFSVIYLVGFVISSFAFVSIMTYKKCREEQSDTLFLFTCIGNGLLLFMLFLLINVGSIDQSPLTLLLVHLIAEVSIGVICILMFLFWNRQDGRKYAQIYYICGAALLLGSFSEYHAEIIVTLLAVLLLVKLMNRNRELRVLDCIVVTWTGVLGFGLSDNWYCWLLAAALVLSILLIRDMHIYHEIVITVSILLICWNQCDYLFDDYGLDQGWLYPVSMVGLLGFFLLFNHLPRLKDKPQKAYNIVCVIFAGIYCLTALSQKDYLLSAVMMVLGAVVILVVFKEKYDMRLPRKHMVLAVFLSVYSLLGHFPSPVIVSILLMVIALGCVGLGFKQQDKTERICGLVMAIFVCVKLVLYDFREVDIIYRMVVFLVVGIMALSISFIYILLEKNMEKKRKELKENGGTE